MYNHIYFLHKEYKSGVVQSQVYELMELLKEKNNVLIVLFLKNDKCHEEIMLIIKKYNLEDNILIIKKSFYNYLYKGNINRLNILLLNSIDCTKKTLIHCRSHIATFIGVRLSKFYTNYKILYDVRGITLEENQWYGLKGKCKKYITEQIIIKVAKECDYYSFVTNNLREYCINTYGYNKNKVSLIIPTCTKKFKVNVQQDKQIYTFVYCGSVYAHQNIEIIMEVFDKINNIFFQKNRKVKFKFLVDSPEYISQLLEKYSYKTEVKNVLHKDIMDELNISDVGVLIRNNSIVNKVSAPTKISEYISANLCVLYSGEIGSLDDLKDMKKELKKVYKFNNIEDINGTLIDNIITNKKEKDYVEYFNWDEHLDKYHRLVEELKE